MREIDDPIPREHAACIVRAAEINKLIINTGKCMRAEHLVGIEEAFSTVMGYLESADTHPPLPPSDGGVAVDHYMDMAKKICAVIEGAVAGTEGEPEKVTLAELTASGPESTRPARVTKVLIAIAMRIKIHASLQNHIQSNFLAHYS